MAFRAPDYSRFAGPRSRAPAWWPIWRMTFRRGWNSVWVKRFTLLGLAIGLGTTVLLYGVQQVLPEWRELLEAAGEGSGQGEVLRFDAGAYLVLLRLFLYPVLLPLAVLLGYDLIAGDLRSNALESYFCRPVTPWTYVLGRTGALLSYLMLATLAPLLWIWIFDLSTAPEGHFETIRRVPFGLSASLLLTGVTLSLLIQALTTLTRSGTWTALALAGLFLGSEFFANMFASINQEPDFRILAFFENLDAVANGFMGFPDETAGRPGFEACVAFQAGVSLLSLAYLLRRVKRSALVG